MSKPTLTELQSLSDQVQRIRDEITMRSKDIESLQVSLEHFQAELILALAAYFKDNPVQPSNEPH